MLGIACQQFILKANGNAFVDKVVDRVIVRNGSQHATGSNAVEIHIHFKKRYVDIGLWFAPHKQQSANKQKKRACCHSPKPKQTGSSSNTQ